MSSDRFKAPALPGKIRDPLAQKVPANPKYRDVRPTVDTGASMTKYLERVREIKSDYKYKKGEIFKRIKVTSFIGLVIEVAGMNESIAEKSGNETPSETASGSAATPSIKVASAASVRPPTSPSLLGPLPPATYGMGPPAMSTRSSRSKRSEPSMASNSLPYFPHPSSLRRSADSDSFASASSASRPLTSYSRSSSSLQGLIGGIGERSSSLGSLDEDKENASTTLTTTTTTTPAPPTLDPPYLLLDIREEDAFNAGHLLTANNFPSSRLSRAFQFESKELRSFRNVEGKIIVVYDEDETMAPRAATILVQRGYDNVYLLSGGINVAEKFFPGGLLWKPESRVADSPSSPPSLNSDDILKLQTQLEEAKLASSPSHRPSVQTCFDRRRTQMIGGQFKQKKTLPKPMW